MKTHSSDAYTEYGSRELLEAALSALNQIPNRRINHQTYVWTYKLAAAIENHLAAAYPVAKTLHEMMQQEKVIGHLWNIEDVQEERPDLTDDQAWQVLLIVDARKDATLGITWDTLSCATDDLFPLKDGAKS